MAAAPGDAVTTSALQLRDTLRRRGRSEIFAAHIHPTMEREVLPLERYRETVGSGGARAIVYHFSIGEPRVTAFLERHRDVPLALVYHNLSPAEAFRPYDPDFADLLDLGRAELAALTPRVLLSLADSQFNADELTALGYEDVSVAPPIDVSDLTAVEPEPTTAAGLATLPGPVILFVGQLLPHKRPDWLLMAFHSLVTHLEPEATLLMVGAARLPQYRSAIETFAAELNLRSARLTGSLEPDALAACFRRADIFFTASEHEGYCVPLVEAMGFGVPVLARSFAAIPGTVGDAGLLLDPDDGPLVAAEALRTLFRDDALRRQLVTRGRRRVSTFDPAPARQRFVDHLSELVGPSTTATIR